MNELLLLNWLIDDSAFLYRGHRLIDHRTKMLHHLALFLLDIQYIGSVGLLIRPKDALFVQWSLSWLKTNVIKVCSNSPAWTFSRWLIGAADPNTVWCFSLPSLKLNLLNPHLIRDKDTKKTSRKGFNRALTHERNPGNTVRKINCYGVFSGRNSVQLHSASVGAQTPIISHNTSLQRPCRRGGLFTTGHPIGLIYGDANKGRKPLSFTCIHGLWFTVNGNIQPFGSWVQADTDEEVPEGKLYTARAAAVGYYMSTAWKTTILRILDLIQSCSVF